MEFSIFNKLFIKVRILYGYFLLLVTTEMICVDCSGLFKKVSTFCHGPQIQRCSLGSFICHGKWCSH